MENCSQFNLICSHIHVLLISRSLTFSFSPKHSISAFVPLTSVLHIKNQTRLLVPLFDNEYVMLSRLEKVEFKRNDGNGNLCHHLAQSKTMTTQECILCTSDIVFTLISLLPRQSFFALALIAGSIPNNENRMIPFRLLPWHTLRTRGERNDKNRLFDLSLEPLFSMHRFILLRWKLEKIGRIRCRLVLNKRQEGGVPKENRLGPPDVCVTG